MHDSDITICISTFLRDQALFRCVESIRSVYPDIRVVVADDGHHTDSKTELLSTVTYLKLPFDSGLAVKRNRMIDVVETEYVVLMDDDMILTEDANFPALKTLMGVADVAGGTLHYPRTGRKRTYTAEMAIRPDILLCTAPKTPWKRHEGVKYRHSDLILNCFMAKTEVLAALRWDERFKITYEHMDFFVRAKLAGVTTVYTPDSEFTEWKERPDDYRTYRLRVAEHKKIFFEKWRFNRLIKSGLQ